MKNSIKREQSQACLNFAERKNFRLKAKHKILMTLALLLTAVTGAWAEGTVYNTTVALKDLKAGDVLTDGFKLTTEIGQYIYVKGYKKDGGTAETGDYMELDAYNSTFPGGVTISKSGSTYTPYADGKDANAWIVSKKEVNGSATKLYLDGYNYTPAIDVTPVAGKTNEWTFTMPAFDVEIAPIYAPVAVFATDGEQVLTPTAAVGIYAESTDSIITPGKVAKIGETENVQGTLMYAVGTSATEQPALTTFSATLPTAKNITAAGDVYVWYYIKGADTPDGETATAENTFNDSEICAEPIKVTVLNNKFDIQFNAANANTIEAKASKGTVSVKEGTDAAVDKTSNITDEGKLEGVKMGSEVKVKANEGYKFRKVEVKKAVTYPLLSAATTDDIGKVVCAAGHLHTAKTAVPSGCTAVGILGKVTSTGHGLILALKDAKDQNWNTINGWTSASYAGTTLKVLPDDAARGTNLTSYTTLGETAVSNWAVTPKSDYEAIFVNLGSTNSNENGTTYDGNVNAYITTVVGGDATDRSYWSATEDNGKGSGVAWYFGGGCWQGGSKSDTYSVWPVLGF